MRRLLWVLLSACCFGTGLTVSRLGLTMFTPLGYTGLRLVVALLTFGVFYALFRRRGPPRRGRLWLLGLGLGVLGTALPMLGIVTALKHLSSGVAAVVATSGPAFAVLFAHALLPDEKITRRKSFGVVLALSGAAALALQGETGLHTRAGGLVGYVILVAALAASHASLVLARKLLRREDVLDVVCIQMLGATLFLAPLSLRVEGVAVLASSWLAWFTVLFGGIVGTFLAFSARFKLVVEYGATDAALVDYVVPAVSTLTGAALAGERVTAPIVLSMAVILLGVRLVQTPGSRSGRRAASSHRNQKERAEVEMTTIETRVGVDLPEVDLRVLSSADGAARREQAARLDQSMRQTGFCVVTGHEVPQELLDRMLSVTRDFFDLPVEVKKAVSSRVAEGQFCGYVPFAADAAARVYGREGEADASPEDLRERFRAVITDCDEVRAKVGPSLWPGSLPELEQVWTEYYRSMEQVGQRLMGLVALALSLDQGFFRPYFERHFSVLMSTNSPVFTGQARPGQARCGVHTDTGTMTFVYQPPGSAGGIEVLVDDTWLVPSPRPGTFIVNCGDLLARWTNDRWRSTIHRVGGPGTRLDQRRQSLVFFHQPALDVTLTCLPTCVRDDNPARFEPITLREHFTNQQRRLGTKDVAASAASGSAS
ncbi:MAG TPA: EamA family transporter [Kofleriaceae bacterium]|nr:EamA family transporter [Kofleriaceae bacterium]